MTGNTQARGINPLLSLAFALHASPGAYAVLLGSGVSRAAAIPTGWEVTQALTDQVARLTAGEVPDPVAWYEQEYGEPPQYSALLDKVAKTPTERRELLRQYFEPTEDEREQGLKLPTKAHRALARLVADGAVRVILTTNFDALMETALREQGVSVAVVSSADAIAGMVPLHVADATVIKLHGDYLDTRIKNTADELRSYAPEVDRLLDQVFDEYGLIVCGWSATWDDALRAAILRAKSRRFTTFWAVRGELTPDARLVAEHRRAEVIAIESADDFFDALNEKVMTLREIQALPPESAAAAVGMAKRYLASQDNRIRLHDLLIGEADAVISRIRQIIPQDPPARWPDLLPLLKRLEATVERLTSIAATVAYWAEPWSRPPLVAAVERIANARPVEGHFGSDAAEGLYQYPAQLTFYSAGLAGLARSDAQDIVADLLLLPQVKRQNDRFVPAVSALNNEALFNTDTARAILGRSGHFTPMSDYLHERLRNTFAEMVPDDFLYGKLFDRFEYYVSLAYIGVRDTGSEVPGEVWAPIGRLAWRTEQFGVATVQQDVEVDIQRDRANWFLLRRGLFVGSPDRLLQFKANLDERLRRRGYGG